MLNRRKKIVHIVHCIDTEGPLYESFSAKFERIKDVFNINIKPTAKNLKKLKLKQIPLNGKEERIATLLSSHLINYNDTWKKIDKVSSLRIWTGKKNFNWIKK